VINWFIFLGTLQFAGAISAILLMIVSMTFGLYTDYHINLAITYAVAVAVRITVVQILTIAVMLARTRSTITPFKDNTNE
jgi:hypothetical protein